MTVRMVSIIPALPVKKISKAAEFYRDRLRFDVGYTDDSFGIVSRDGVEIHLWAASDQSWTERGDIFAQRPVQSGAESFLAGTASCRIEVLGIDALFAEMQRSGVLYSSETVVTLTPWRTREFPVLDLERNLLTFYERTSG